MTFEARPLCNLTVRRSALRYGKVIFQLKLDIIIDKASDSDALNILFHFIFIPICILKIE